MRKRRLQQLHWQPIFFLLIFILAVATVGGDQKQQNGGETTTGNSNSDIGKDGNQAAASALQLLDEIQKQGDEEDYFDIPPIVEEDEDASNETRKPILVSYLAAVSGFTDLLFNKIHVIASSNESLELTKHMGNHMRDAACFATHFEGSKISGALRVAIDDVNNNPELLPGYKLKYLYNNTCGEEIRSTEYLMNHWKQGAKVFIGPEMNCRTEATMAAAQNLPLISHKCKDQTVSDKKRYPTFARTVPAESVIARSFMALLKHFCWHKFTMIFETTPANGELHNAIRRTLEDENQKHGSGQGGGSIDEQNESHQCSDEDKYQILNTSQIPHPFSEVEINYKEMIRHIVAETKATTRIYVTFGNVRLFRRILFEMGEQDLMLNGDYALLYLDTDYNWLNVYHAMNNHFIRDTIYTLHESWDDPKLPDRKLVNYSRSALAIIPTPVHLDSPVFREFWRKANAYIRSFGILHNHPDLQILTNRFACYLYDAVTLYANALHESIMEARAINLTDEEAIDNGQQIISKILGRKYKSMQGFDMRIDENGDAEGNYTLLALQPVEPVMNQSHPDYYPLHEALTISADFMAVQDPADLPQLRFKRAIRWPTGRPPRDEPECGFDGRKCGQDDHYSWWSTALLLTFATMILFFGIAAIVTYRLVDGREGTKLFAISVIFYIFFYVG